MMNIIRAHWEIKIFKNSHFSHIDAWKFRGCHHSALPPCTIPRSNSVRIILRNEVPSLRCLISLKMCPTSGKMIFSCRFWSNFEIGKSTLHDIENQIIVIFTFWTKWFFCKDISQNCQNQIHVSIALLPQLWKLYVKLKKKDIGL